MTVGELIVRCGLDTSSFNAQSNQVRSGANSLAGFLKGAFSFTVGMGMFSLIQNGMQALKDTLIGFNAEMEQNTIAFETLTGSAKTAKDFLSNLQTMAANTPFEFKDLASSSKKLLAFGFNLKEIPKMMTAIGDASSGLGMSGADGLNRIGIALGQIKAKSRVQAQEMLQLTEAGIPAWDILAKAMGKSTAEVMKLSEQGLIPANQAINALVDGMEQRFPNMMDKQSKSFNGLMSTLKDNLQMTISQVGIKAFNSLEGAISGAVQKTQLFADTFKNAGLKEAMKTILPPELVNTLSSLFGFIKTNVLPILGDIISKAGTIAMGLLPSLGKGSNDLGSALGDLVTGGLRLFADLLGWIESHLPLVKTALYGVLYAIVAYKTVATIVQILLALKNAYLLISSSAALAKIQVIAMQGAVVLGATAIGEAAYLIYQNWQNMPDFFKSLGKRISSETGTLGSSIVYVFQDALYKVRTFINQVNMDFATLMAKTGKFLSNIPGVGKKIQKAFSSGAKAMTQYYSKKQDEANNAILKYANKQQNAVDKMNTAEVDYTEKFNKVKSDFKASLDKQFKAIKSLIIPSTDPGTIKTPKVVDSNKGFDVSFDSAGALQTLKTGVANAKGKAKAVLSTWQVDLNKQLDNAKNALKGGLTNNKSINTAINNLKKAKNDAWKQYVLDSNKYGKNSKQAQSDLKIIRNIDTQIKGLNQQIQKNINTNILNNSKKYTSILKNNMSKYLNSNRLKIDAFLNDLKLNPENILKDYDNIIALFNKDLGEAQYTKNEAQRKLNQAETEKEKAVYATTIKDADKTILDIQQKIQDAKTEQVQQLKQQYDRDKGVQSDMLIKWTGLLVDSLTGDVKKNKALIQAVKQQTPVFNTNYSTNNNVSLTEGAVAAGVIKALEYLGMNNPSLNIDIAGAGISTIATVNNAKLAGHR